MVICSVILTVKADYKQLCMSDESSVILVIAGIARGHTSCLTLWLLQRQLQLFVFPQVPRLLTLLSLMDCTSCVSSALLVTSWAYHFPVLVISAGHVTL